MSDEETTRELLKRIERRVDHLAWFVLMLLILTAIMFARVFGVTWG